MSTYKCICCGTIKESDGNCSCPQCGYKMFEEPYERSEKLRDEIRNFISQLELKEIDESFFKVYRESDKKTGKHIYKVEDEHRFPDFEKIKKYVCSAEKTEIFFERLSTSINEIRKYIKMPYENEYSVSFDTVCEKIDELDVVLNKALEKIGIDIELQKTEFPNVRLLYKEFPDEYWYDKVNLILDSLQELSEKIEKFIKQNNIYGATYQKSVKNTAETLKIEDFSKCFEKSKNAIKKVIEKKYTIDILSDGTDELNEMLKVLWKTLEIIMLAPIFKRDCEYILDDSYVLKNNEFYNAILEQIKKRYLLLNNVISAEDFLYDKSEDELFEVYNKMIELDVFSFICTDKSNLMKIGEGEKKLNELIGLNEIKESIKKIKAYVLANRDSENLNIHMCFLGNPGTGKTEVARHIANILYENKILPTNNVIEVDRSGLVSQFFGATAEKTKNVIEKALGGVLFIDEAYALGNNSDREITDYGKEAIDTLVKAMEDYRGKFCVIFAGYKNEMLKMLTVNPGLKSRIQFMLDFPNYSRDELKNIAKLMLRKRNYVADEQTINRILDITDIRKKDPYFSNAREIRNILDQTIMYQSLRCLGTEDRKIGLIDINKYINDNHISLPEAPLEKEKRILTGEEELDRLIGLDSVKRMIKKIKAYAKRNKGEENFNLHMCFFGNPGTGKTEVARILSRILYEAGALSEAKLVETSGYGLLGKHVGETAPKTEAKINEAINGVLFIDEAYGLVGTKTIDGSTSNFGEEAVNVLLKEMEDRRGQFCVVFAGYKEEMQNLLDLNPGFESRIQFKLNFPDYSREELAEIAKKILSQKKYMIDSEALKLILDVSDYLRNRANFANARTIRNVIDQVIMNQNLRTEDCDDDRTIIAIDVEEYLIDEAMDIPNLRQK